MLFPLKCSKVGMTCLDARVIFDRKWHLMARLEANIKSVREISGLSILGLIMSKMPVFLLVQVWF